MSQSNDSPAPCADKGGHGKATTSVCDTLRSEARGQKKINRNGDDINSYSSDGEEEELMGVWKVMQQFEPPIRKCSVRCPVEVSQYGHRRARTSLRRERRAEF